MEKRNIIIFTIGLIFLISLIPNFALAVDATQLSTRSLDWGWMGQGIKDFFGGVLSWALFDPGLQNEYPGEVFAKALLSVILVLLLHGLVKKFPHVNTHTSVPWIISVAITILGVRFISFGMLQAILLPYGALAIIISMIVPFLAFFYFVEDIKSPWFRKFSWFFYAAVMVGLWWSRPDIPGEVAGIYLWFALTALILMVGDRMWQAIKTRKSVSADTSKEVAGVVDELKIKKNILVGQLKNPHRKKDWPQIKKDIKDIEKQIVDMKGKFG
jgi:hypothetical protein